MANKKVVFRVFTIKNEELTLIESDLRERLKLKLAGTTVQNRLKNAKDDDDSIQDLLSSYAPAGATDADYLYGTIMQLKAASHISALPDNFLQMSSLSESELQAIPGMEGKKVCSRLYHFLVKGNLLITDLQQNCTISCFSNYLEKLLPEKKYGFVPTISNRDIKLCNLVHVTFSDTFNEPDQEFTIKNPVMKLIKMMSPEVKGLNKILSNKMVKAKMSLDFARPKGMSEDDYAMKLGSLLAPVQDLSFVQFTMNNGLKVYGNDLAYTKRVTLEDDVINDMTYIRAMKAIVEELNP